MKNILFVQYAVTNLLENITECSVVTDVPASSKDPSERESCMHVSVSTKPLQVLGSKFELIFSIFH